MGSEDDGHGAGRYRLHGLTLSYFTGKIEAYLRVKGVPFDFVEMDMRDFRRCAQATGVAQMPQIECPDGSWLTDSTDIIAHFEGLGTGPRLRPLDPLTAYVSLLLEDLFDEWLWRPALYYRWAFADDARLMSARIAKTMLRDVPLPLALRQRFILHRQRRVYLTEDGITARTGPQVEALYLATLDALEQVFASRPFLMGDHPCEADFGLFGPMFRHFFSDPTPAGLMRARAPRTMAWVARLWALRPDTVSGSVDFEACAEDLAPFLSMAGGHYLPYLAANAAAFVSGDKAVAYTVDDVAWRIPLAPYRVRCLADLQRGYQALDAAHQARVSDFLGPGVRHLQGPQVTAPDAPVSNRKPLNRQWAGR